MTSMENEKNEPNAFTYVLVVLYVWAVCAFANSDFYKSLHKRPETPENPYKQKVYVKPDLPETKPKKRQKVEPDEGMTLLDIEDEVDRNGDDDLEFYDYILK